MKVRGETHYQCQKRAISVTAVRFKGQVHPFVYIGGVIEDANVARRLIGSQLKAAFESSMADTTAL